MSESPTASPTAGMVVTDVPGEHPGVAARAQSRGAALDLLAAAALWGGMYVVSAGTFDAIPPLTLGVLRLVVGVAVLAVAFRGRLGLAGAPRGRIVAAGAVVAATLVMQFVGTSMTGGAEGALLTTTTPVFVLLFGVLLEGERVRRVAWAGCLVALAGVAVLAARNGGFGGAAGPDVVLPGNLALPRPLLGDLLLVGSAATWALFSSVGRPLVVAVGAFRAILGASAVAIVLLLPFVPLELAGRSFRPITPLTVVAILYLGIGATALAWSLWYRGYAAAPPAVSAAAFFAQPVVGAVLGVLILGEVLGPAFFGGAALIAAGVLGIAAATRGRREAPD
jgi:drug/metabolite transporter (DMT)-like permease